MRSLLGVVLVSASVGCGELLDVDTTDDPVAEREAPRPSTPPTPERGEGTASDVAGPQARTRCPTNAAFKTRVPLRSSVTSPFSLTLSEAGLGVLTFRRGLNLRDPIGVSLVELAGNEMRLRPESPGSSIENADVKATTLSADGKTLVLERDERGESELWLAQRPTSAMPFPTPTRLDGTNDEATPYLVGSHLYVSRGRGARGLSVGTLDLAQSELRDLTELPALTLESADHPVVSADELEIFFVAKVAFTTTVFHATRASTADAFGVPFPLLESNGTEYPTWISANGCELFTVSDPGLGAPEVHRLVR